MAFSKEFSTLPTGMRYKGLEKVSYLAALLVWTVRPSPLAGRPAPGKVPPCKNRQYSRSVLLCTERDISVFPFILEESRRLPDRLNKEGVGVYLGSDRGQFQTDFASLFGQFVNVLGDAHRAEFRAAHGAELGAFEDLLRQSFVMHAAGRFRVQG